MEKGEVLATLDPDWIRPVAELILPNVAAAYALYDPPAEAAQEPDRQVKLLAVAPCVLLACKISYRPDPSNPPAYLATYEAEALPLSAVTKLVLEGELYVGETNVPGPGDLESADSKSPTGSDGSQSLWPRN